MSRLSLAMGERTELTERLGQVGRVLRLQALVTWALRLLVLGLVVDCLLLAVSRFLPYSVKPALLLLAPAALAIMGGIVGGFWQLQPRTIARRADRALGLKERLLTAVELQRHPPQSPLVGLQLRDALDQFRRHDPSDYFPVRLPGRELNALLVFSVLAVGLVLAPNPMEQVVRQREQVAVTIKQEAERIRKLADELAALEDQDDFVDVQDVLRAAAAAIGDRQLSPEQANAVLQRLEQQLQAKQDPTVGELEDALSSLAGSLASEPATRDLGTSLARGDVRQAAREMRRLGEEAAALSQADRQKLSRALRQAASRMSRSNPMLSQSLLRASDALEAGQLGEAAQALGEASDQLENVSGRLRAASQRERALAQLQQSRGAINRSQQLSQQRGSGQRSMSRSAGFDDDDFDGASGFGDDDGDSMGSDRPGGSGAGSGSGGRDETIYDPLLTIGRPDFVPGQTPFDPNDMFENPGLDSPYGNEAQVGYKQVFAEYEQRATQTLQSTYIPAGLKDIVKEYFSALAPNK
jgi:hypothetical protein